MGEETNATEPIMNFAETLHDFEKISRRCRDMLYEAHEREVDALRGDTYLDAVSDSVLAKHGLVRLPVDADGVRSIADRLRKMGSAERAAQTSAAPSGHAASRSSGSSTSTRTKRRTAPSAANSLRGMRAAHGRITAPTAGRG